MSKGRREKKKAPFVDIYAVLILIATLIMSIAYAEIVGTELTVATKAEASAQEGVFITNVVCNESNSVSNNYMATTLDSSITLDSPTETKTFTITIYNKTLKPHVFVGVKKLDSWDEFTGVYNNTNISYTFGNDMVPYKTILPAKEWITFNVDLGFNGQGTMPETLRSLLNFSFQEIPTLEIVSEDTIENIYPNCKEQVYEFTVSNQRQDETHGLLTNGVPLTYTIAPNVPAPLTAKIYDKDGTEVAANQKIIISSEAKEEQTYTMKVKWDNTNPENGKEYNSAEYAGKTLASTIKIIATPNLVDGYDKYNGHTFDKSESVEIKTAPLYFGVTTDKTTVEMNNTTNAEKIILTIKNNDGAEKINSFPVEYKLSIDNSKVTLLVDGSEIGENTIELAGTTATTQTKELQLVSKTGQELEATENCNLSIQSINPYSKTETIALTITDTTGPTAPAITGGSTGAYALEQTISVSEVATDVGTGVDKYQYLLNSTESTETTAIADVTTTATSQLFTEDAPGYYVYFRAVDNAGNPGEWSNAQQLYIDTKPPIVEATEGTAVIEEGESHTMTEYFSYDANGNASVEVTYTVDGTEITNTNTLKGGSYTITCTAVKANGTTVSATKAISVQAKVNAPKTVSGMIPVYYDNGVWKKADTTNKNLTSKWYDYAEKRWANVATVTSSNLSKYSNAAVGTTINQSEITAMFVWIPRYSYVIKGEKDIDVTFLQGTTSKDAWGNTTTGIVHPVFTDGSKNNYAQGGWDEELTGFWVAKFEASGVENGVAVGNASASSSSEQQAPTSSTYVRILPNVISWRHITVGEAQYRSMQMSSNTSAYGWASGAVDSHLIKNDEWGAVAYLCYSDYGIVPMTNGATSYSLIWAGYYDAYTGAGPASTTSEVGYAYTTDHAYNTSNGVLSSTTGNVYGVYDMAGGAWERVGGYLDNLTFYSGTYGKSSSDTNVTYFEKNSDGYYELKDEYQKYWCRYEVGEEERSNKIVINSSTIMTQAQLWTVNNNLVEHNAARLRITKETFNKFANYKGIAVGEILSTFSYIGVDSAGTWRWFTDTTQPTINTTGHGRFAWDNDYCLVGHANYNFVNRGGDFESVSSAGVLACNCTNGGSFERIRFPPGVGCT